MKNIELTQGFTAVVDDEDFDSLSQHRWCAHVSRKDPLLVYAQRARCGAERREGKSNIKMHRTVIGAKRGQTVDHINGDTLDNRRCNLRIVTARESALNRGMQKHNTSGYRGVACRADRSRWTAQIAVGGKQVHLGYFDTAEDAAHAYDAAALKHNGKFAKLNFAKEG